MTVTVYYKTTKTDDMFICDMWGIDSNNHILKMYRDMKTKTNQDIQRCVAFIRLTEIRKVEIDYET
jgi:hypothetical protein